MQLKRSNRDGAENMYVSIKNVEGATITTGTPVAYAGTNSLDGNSAVLANAAADYARFLGVSLTDIPNNQYGRVQVSGYIGSILVSGHSASVTINAGDPLVPNGGAFTSAAPTYANAAFRWIAACSNVPSVACSAIGQYVSGVMRSVV